MATRIIEYGGSGEMGSAYPVIPADEKVTEQAAMTATGTSAQSAAVNSATCLVIVDTDEQVYVSLGVNPTATTNSLRIPAGARAEFSIRYGLSWKVAIRT